MKGQTRTRVVIGEGRLEVGELIFEEDGVRQSSMFRYALSWLERPNRFALSPVLPLTETPFYASGHRESRRSALPGPIADGAPDSWGRGILRKALGRQLSEVEFLLKTDDLTRQGALRYLDAEGRPSSQDVPSVPRLTDLDALAHLARLYERDPALGHDELRRLIADAGSLGGARPKANFDDAGTLSIAKFTSERDTVPIERMEVATLRLARAAGINAATARIEMGNTDAPVAIIARFDRRKGARVPTLSAQSFMGAEEATGGFYTDFADQLRAHGANPAAQMEELHRRIMFTILVSNTDDHLKNHALLYAGDQKWALAPAFDINPQPERHRHLETGISELSGYEASIEAAVEAAPFFDVSRDRAVANLTRLVDTIDAQWKDRCREAGMSPREVAAYRGAFQHAEADKARAMIAPYVAAQPAPTSGPGRGQPLGAQPDPSLPVSSSTTLGRVVEAVKADAVLAEAEAALRAARADLETMRRLPGAADKPFHFGPRPPEEERDAGLLDADGHELGLWGPPARDDNESEEAHADAVEAWRAGEVERTRRVAQEKAASWAGARDAAHVALGTAEGAIRDGADGADAAEAALGTFATLRERVRTASDTLGPEHEVARAMEQEWGELLAAHPRVQEAALEDQRGRVEAVRREAEAARRQAQPVQSARLATSRLGYGGPSGP